MKQSNSIARTTGKPQAKRGGLRSTSWKPGQSGNPAGGPTKEKAYSHTVSAMLDSEQVDLVMTQNGKKRVIQLKGPKGTTLRQILASAQLEAAMNGDVQAARELVDRCDGKVTDKHEVNVTTTPESIVQGIVHVIESKRDTRRGKTPDHHATRRDKS